MPTRLIDLHVDWLLQYAPDSTAFDPARYPGVKERLTQTAGYLQTTRAAVLACYRDAGEWADRPDAWAALVELIARAEAEFAGRLLIGPDDFDRWEDDQDGLTWGVLGVEGFDSLIRSAADLSRLQVLFERGLRVFQPVYTATTLLGGSSAGGDDRNLTELGRSFLETLLALAPAGPGPRPLLDLAHLNHATSGDVLAWYEAEPGRADRLPPIYSHGTMVHSGFDQPRALPVDHARRLRALGGFVGVSVSPPFFQAAEQVEQVVRALAEFPHRDQAGLRGIGVGTDFLGVDRTLPKLGDAPEVLAWFFKTFGKADASALVHDNPRKLLARAAGAENLI